MLKSTSPAMILRNDFKDDFKDFKERFTPDLAAGISISYHFGTLIFSRN